MSSVMRAEQIFTTQVSAMGLEESFSSFVGALLSPRSLLIKEEEDGDSGSPEQQQQPTGLGWAAPKEPQPSGGAEEDRSFPGFSKEKSSVMKH